MGPVSSPTVVEALIHAGLEGMEGLDQPYTELELASAAFTLTLRVIEAVLKTRPDLLHTMRQGAQVLLMRCVDEKLH